MQSHPIKQLSLRSKIYALLSKVYAFYSAINLLTEYFFCRILDARTQKMISSNPYLIAASDYMQTNAMASRVLSQVQSDTKDLYFGSPSSGMSVCMCASCCRW
jgi:hypothetical protein